MQKIIFTLQNGVEKEFTILEDNQDTILTRNISYDLTALKPVATKWSLKGTKKNQDIESFMQELFSEINSENLISEITILTDEVNLKYSSENIEFINYALNYDNSTVILYELIIEIK